MISINSDCGGVGMESSELRARCAPMVRSVLATTPLPDPWDCNEFLDGLERERGRNIDVLAVDWTRGQSTGAWRRYADHDVILYAANTSVVHQDHIILHEVGHMLFEHRGRCVLSSSDAQRLAPSLAPAAFAHMLDRVSVQAEEAEAETFATMVLTRLVRQERRRRPRQRVEPEVDATLTRLAAVFDQ